jgi:hypothetical protein
MTGLTFEQIKLFLKVSKGEVNDDWPYTLSFHPGNPGWYDIFNRFGTCVAQASKSDIERSPLREAVKHD